MIPRPTSAPVGLAVALTAVLLASQASAQGAPGTFSGTFEFRWLSEPSDRHRQMQLLSPVSFTDAAGKVWAVPVGTVVDGASIPPELWTIAGSPFVGNYRRASVVHDHFCDTVTTGGDPVHSMFQEAMIADGVSWLEALVKYGAVKLYGATFGRCGRPAEPLIALESMSQANRLRLPGELRSVLRDVRDLGADGGTRPPMPAPAIADLAEIRARQTYEALVAHAQTPSSETLDGLRVAVAAEEPTMAEMEVLTTLAAASVPRTAAPPR